MAHKTYIICIGGFTQGIGDRSGLFRLWLKLLRLRGPNVSVDLWKWDTRWGDVAEQIFLASEDWENTRIVVAAFSYGGGWGFLRLARELGRRGLDIETAVLSDAVYRTKHWLFKWLAFVDWPVIKVPDNVRQVFWFFQRMDRPRGHKVVAVDEIATKIEPGVQLHASHVFCDDHASFHKLAISVAEKAVADSAIEEAVSKQAIVQEKSADRSSAIQ